MLASLLLLLLLTPLCFLASLLILLLLTPLCFLASLLLLLLLTPLCLLASLLLLLLTPLLLLLFLLLPRRPTRRRRLGATAGLLRRQVWQRFLLRRCRLLLLTLLPAGPATPIFPFLPLLLGPLSGIRRCALPSSPRVLNFQSCQSNRLHYY